MHRLPAKTTAPIRMPFNGRDQPMNGHVRPEPTVPPVEPVQPVNRVPMLRLLRFPAIHERTGLSRSTIWRLERHGDFPKHRRISANAVAWVEEEVITWIRSRIDAVTM